MDREKAIKRAIEYADEGFLCVEAVLKTLADMKGVESNFIPSIATGMAAGIARTNQICGAVTGAILGLGLWFGRNEPIVSDRKPYWYSRLFLERWLEVHSSSNCSELLGVDLDTPEGYTVYSVEKMWDNKCKRYIEDAVGTAYDILVDASIYSVGA